MPTLYANKVSQPCRSLLWFIDYANRKDIDIRIVDVQARDHKRPEFLAKFPSGQIPAYEEGDLLFSESTAILEYLAHNHPLLPTDARKLAKLHEYFARHDTEARKLTTEYVWPWFVAKSRDEMLDRKRVGYDVIKPILDKYDSWFAKYDYVLGPTLSLADFMFAPEIDQVVFADSLLFDRFPNISRYLRRLRQEVTGYSHNIDTAASISRNMADSRGW
ncbi:Glutathione S-transferase [Diplonema papillatum]|nr:Glutathione S-transferase [Diplonema papillatum]